jgi:hypothetical protein
MDRDAASPSRSRRAALAVLDAIHRRPAGDPHVRFQARFAVGASLLALAVAVPTLAVAVARADGVDAALTGALIGALTAQLVAIRLRAPMAIMNWLLLATAGLFLVASTLVPGRLEPQQLFWLVLLPLAAHALAGPRGADGRTASAGAPLVMLGAVLAAGLALVLVRDVGYTLDPSARLAGKLTLAFDFVTFTLAAYGLVYVYDLSIREAHADLARLRQLLSVCAWCKKIHHQDDWIPLERYLRDHQRHDLTHGICPSCLERQLQADEGPPKASSA